MERETVAAERVNTNAAGKSRQATSGEVEEKEGALQVEERQMARAVFSLQYDFLCTKTVITQGTHLLTGVETLCFVFVCTFFFFFFLMQRSYDRHFLSICQTESCSCPAALLCVDDICFLNLSASYGDKYYLPCLRGNSPVCHWCSPAFLLCHCVIVVLPCNCVTQCLGLNHFKCQWLQLCSSKASICR